MGGEGAGIEGKNGKALTLMAVKLVVDEHADCTGGIEAGGADDTGRGWIGALALSATGVMVSMGRPGLAGFDIDVIRKVDWVPFL